MNPFTDISSSKFRNDILWIYDRGITAGCAEDRYCPKGLVTRAQMATFLTRALNLSAAARDYFTDDAGNKHEARINALAQAGITVGCSATRFCPEGTVTRAQMATFLVRGFGLQAAVRDYYADDAGNKHEPRINALAQAGVTRGCTATAYCPWGAVTREQMAAFLHRALVPRSNVLVGAGDIASCSSSGDEATASLLDGIAGTVFTTGDNVYDSGTPTEYADCYDSSWGRHRHRTLPAPGNHDWRTANAHGYRDYFGLRSGPLWYSYNLGAWHVVVLDSNCASVGGCGVGSPQHTWLVDDLASDTRACTLAIWHQPRFSSGAHGSSTAMAAFWQELYADGAELVINGHDHNYERFAPQSPSGVPDAKGIREIVVGTGGKTLRPFGVTVANSEVRNSTAFGVLKVTLAAGSYSWQFLPVAGGTFTDAGTGTCH
ncbi:MAG: S-layer homology domain-containing protein [Gemmatimonadaceae bacterium]|nr:S-layer homology domain-containing protein [Gemmatimonadaceae bacterium]